MRWILFALATGCAGASNEPAEPTEPVEHAQSSATAPTPAPNAAPSRVATSHEALVAEAAREYKSWKLVDDEFHWAPGLCAMPKRGWEHVSAAKGSAHDGKLFLLWARDIESYANAVGWLKPNSPAAKAAASRQGKPGDVMQVLVKDSYVAKEFDPSKPGEQRSMSGVSEFELHPAMQGGKPFVPGDPIGLFVMIQLAGNPEGTDEGWIYGTVSPDGTVTSATDAGACRDCHSKRDNRLFGVQRPHSMGM